MALEASHIRFALDIKDILGVVDTDAYVSGSIYPDSRYVSGIDRLATHPEDYRSDPMFRTSDFRKGWFAHLFADDIQQAAMRGLLPQTQRLEGEGREDSWIKRTAIKVLQDIDDASRFELTKYLPALAHVENPNGEDLEKVRQYNNIFPAMYADSSRLDIRAQAEMWKKFGIGEELAEKVREKAEEYSKDRAVMGDVRGLYDVMLSRARQELG